MIDKLIYGCMVAIVISASGLFACLITWLFRQGLPIALFGVLMVAMFSLWVLLVIHEDKD